MNTANKTESFAARAATAFKKAFRTWATTPSPFYGNLDWTHYTRLMR